MREITLFKAVEIEKIGLVLESGKTDVAIPMPSSWWEMVAERYKEVSEDKDYDQKDRVGAKNIADIIQKSLDK